MARTSTRPAVALLVLAFAVAASYTFSTAQEEVASNDAVLSVQEQFTAW